MYCVQFWVWVPYCIQSTAVFINLNTPNSVQKVAILSEFVEHWGKCFVQRILVRSIAIKIWHYGLRECSSSNDFLICVFFLRRRRLKSYCINTVRIIFDLFTFLNYRTMIMNHLCHANRRNNMLLPMVFHLHLEPTVLLYDYLWVLFNKIVKTFQPNKRLSFLIN